MLGELVRVRIDAAHIPNQAKCTRADAALPTGVAIATLIPDILAIFDIDIADYPLAQWQLCTSSGRVLRADDTLAQANIAHGERLVISNDPGPVPTPRVFDAADAITDTTYTDGIGDADTAIGCVAALAATIAVAVASISLSNTDTTLGAALSFVTLMGIAGGLRVALVRQARSAIVLTLSTQLVVLTTSSALCFTGLEPALVLTEWPPSAAVAAGLTVLGLALVLAGAPTRGTSSSARITSTVGAIGIVGAVSCGCYSYAISLFGNPAQAGAFAVAVSVLLVLLAPAIAIKAAGIRVPRIPAAGESFDDCSIAEIPESAPRRAGWLFDGLIAAGTVSLGVFTLVCLLCDDSRSHWTLSLGMAVVVFGLIHSRGQARKIAQFASALTSLSVALAIGALQWFDGTWPVAAVIVVPLLAGTALEALPTRRISPTTRRIAELTEACSIAAILPLVAIIADLPAFIAGVLQ